MRGEVTFYILIRVGLVFLRVAASSNKALEFAPASDGRADRAPLSLIVN
jgi:hypothetical protein